LDFGQPEVLGDDPGALEHGPRLPQPPAVEVADALHDEGFGDHLREGEPLADYGGPLGRLHRHLVATKAGTDLGQVQRQVDDRRVPGGSRGPGWRARPPRDRPDWP